MEYMKKVVCQVTVTREGRITALNASIWRVLWVVFLWGLRRIFRRRPSG